MERALFGEIQAKKNPFHLKGVFWDRKNLVPSFDSTKGGGA